MAPTWGQAWPAHEMWPFNVVATDTATESTQFRDDTDYRQPRSTYINPALLRNHTGNWEAMAPMHVQGALHFQTTFSPPSSLCDLWSSPPPTTSIRRNVAGIYRTSTNICRRAPRSLGRPGRRRPATC